jgi:hypothetical protein
MDVAELALGAALVVVAAGLLAASFRFVSTAEFLLAGYLLADAMVVGLTEGLSPWHAVTRAGYLIGLGAIAAGAAAVWWARGRPRPPTPPLDELRELRSHRLLLVLGGVVLLGLAYELVIGITTPPNDWDAMHHHLVRAAAWRQRHAVEAIPNVNDTFGVNQSPPDGEIQMLFTLVLLGRDTLATLPQFLAECALLVSVFGIARRVGFGLAPSLFAALLTATLSDVAVQSVAAQTDLSVAAAVVAAAFFALGTGAANLGLAGLAVGLALGTKVTAVLALPVIAVVAFAAGGVRRVFALAVTSAAGFALLGVYIYARGGGNAGSVAGVPATGNGSLRSALTPVDIVSTGARVLYRFSDLSGFEHAMNLPKVGLVLLVVPAVAFAVAARPRDGKSRLDDSWPWAVALATVVPLAVFCVGLLGHGVFALLHIPPNPAGATANGRFRFGVNVQSGEGVSYYGPLGAFLLWPLCVATFVGWARGRVDRRLAALAAALPIFVFCAAAALSYTPEIGRYFIAPVALAMPLAALVYRNRLVTRAACMVAIAFLVLAQAFNLTKPIGLAGSTPIWSLSLAEAQTLERPSLRPLLERVAARVPQDARVGLVLDSGDWSYPFYGSRLGRKVTYLAAPPLRREAVAAGVSWLIVHEPPAREGDAGVWKITKVGR